MPRNWRTSGNGELMKLLIIPLLVVTWRLYIEDWWAVARSVAARARRMTSVNLSIASDLPCGWSSTKSDDAERWILVFGEMGQIVVGSPNSAARCACRFVCCAFPLVIVARHLVTFSWSCIFSLFHKPLIVYADLDCGGGHLSDATRRERCPRKTR
jgi:hypothetical protein